MEEKFLSDSYNVEFDWTDSAEVRLGFYRIRPKPAVRDKHSPPRACPGFEPLCRAFYLEHIEALLSQGRVKEARQALRRAEAAGLGADGSHWAEPLYQKIGLFDRALKAIDARLDPRSAEAGLLVSRAELLVKLLRKDEARVSLQKARSLAPGEPEMRRMAVLYRTVGTEGDVLAMLDGVAGKRPLDAGVQLERAESFLELGRHDESRAALKKAVRLGLPPEQSRRAAWVFQALGEYGDCVRLWDKLLSVPEPRAKDLSDRAVCAFRGGDWEGAVANLRRALELEPRSLEAHASLAAVYAGRGLAEQALKVYEQGLAIAPSPGDEALRRQLTEGRELLLRRRKSGPGVSTH